MNLSWFSPNKQNLQHLPPISNPHKKKGEKKIESKFNHEQNFNEYAVKLIVGVSKDIELFRFSMLNWTLKGRSTILRKTNTKYKIKFQMCHPIKILEN